MSVKRQDIVEKVQQAMSAKRFAHVLGVEQTAIELARRYGASEEQAGLAGLTHDYAKERSDEEFQQAIQAGGYDPELLKYGNNIWHGLVGADFVAAELGIRDEAVLQAIRLHTVGAAEMTLLDKIIYVADYIEPGRNFPGVAEARALAATDLDQAVAFEAKHTLQFLLAKGLAVYPQSLETYNYWTDKLR